VREILFDPSPLATVETLGDAEDSRLGFPRAEVLIIYDSINLLDSKRKSSFAFSIRGILSVSRLRLAMPKSKYAIVEKLID